MERYIIFEVKEQRRMSWGQMEKLFGVNKGTLWRYAHGHKNISKKQMDKIERKLTQLGYYGKMSVIERLLKLLGFIK